MAYIGKTPVIGNFVKLDSITVVNGQAAYTMQNGGVNFTSYDNVNQFLVSLNGVLQAPTDSFTVSGSTLTFASNLSTGDVIDFVLVLGNSLDIGTPSDNTVSLAKLTATGTKDATTFLRGDNTFAVAGSPSIDDNGTATAITIDSSQNVDVAGTLTIDDTLSISNGTASGFLQTSGSLLQFGTSTAGDIAVYSNNTERMRIDSSGRVGIGSTPASGAKLYVPAHGQTTDAWVRHGSTAYASGSWGGGADIRVSWDIVNSVSYVLEFLTASYGARQQFIVGSYYAGSQHQTIIANNGNTGTMTQGDHPTAQESWRSSAGTHGVYCVRITSANGLDNALVEIL